MSNEKISQFGSDDSSKPAWTKLPAGMTYADLKAFAKLYGVPLQKIELPTEDEVYDKALHDRAKNMSEKLKRLNFEIRDEAEALVKKSDEAMRTKMELNVLLEEIGDSAKIGDWTNGSIKGESLASKVEGSSTILRYTGPQILKAYAQLKAVFDIDNERPAYSAETWDYLKTMKG